MAQRRGAFDDPQSAAGPRPPNITDPISHAWMPACRYSATTTACQGNCSRGMCGLNAQTMAKYRPEMKKYYYDPSKYKSYLEQLGIKYPIVRATPSSQSR